MNDCKEILKSTSVLVLLNRKQELLADLEKLNSLKVDNLDLLLCFAYGHSCCRFNLEDVIKKIDKQLWGELLNNTPFFDIMPPDERREWDAACYTGSHRFSSHQPKFEVPAFTLENIGATLETLYNRKDEMFEDKVLDVFKSLSWNHKTNSPVAFGEKLIIEAFGYSSCGYKADYLDALEDVVHILNGRNIPSYDMRVRRKLDTWNPSEATDEYFRVKTFKNKNLHLWFKDKSIVKKLNKIIAHRYGSRALGRSK